MEEPLVDMLKDPESDMPYCICWANESWSRTWDGKENDITRHRDVTALLAAGLLQKNEQGLVEFPYDAVKVEFLLEAA